MAESTIGPRIAVAGEKEFKAAMASINNEFKMLGSEMKLAVSQFDKNDKSTAALTAQNKVLGKEMDAQKGKIALLTTQYDKQNEKLSTLKTKLDATKAAFGADSAEVAKAQREYDKQNNTVMGLQTQLNGATTSLNNMDREMKESNKNIALQESGWTKLGKSMTDTGNKLDKIGKGFGTVGTAMVKGITAPILAAGAALLKLGDEFEKSYNTIRIGTGATGDALKGLQADFKATLSQTGSSMADVSKAVTDLNKRTGLSGQSLQDLSLQMLKLAKISKEDLSTLIPATTRMFGDAGIAQKDYAGALDYTFKVTQQTGIGIGRLQELMTQFGGPLRQMGFDWQTSAAMLGKFEKEGVNTELVVGSLRIALGKMAKDGIKEPAKELQGMIEKIKAAGTAGEANALSLSMFGAKAGPDMAAAIREGRMDLTGLLQTLKDSPETINKAAADTMTFTGKLAKLKNQIAVSFEPIGTNLIESLEKLTPVMLTVSNAIANVAKKFADLDDGSKKIILAIVGIAAVIGPTVYVIGSIITAVGAIAGAFGVVSTAIAAAGGIIAFAVGIITSPITIAIVAIAAIIAIGVLLCKNWDTIKAKAQELWASVTGTFDNIKTSISEVWENIKTATLQAWESLKSAVSNGLGAILNFLQPALTFYQTIFTNAWDIIKNIVLGAVLIVLDIVTGNFTKLGTDIGGIWNNIKTALMNIWEAIKGVAINAWNGLKNGVISITGGIRDGVFSVWNSILSFFRNLPGTLYSLGSSAFNSLKSGISSVLNTIGSTIISGFDGAIKFLSGLPGMAYGWGKDFIQGLINGIGDMIDAVKNAAGGVGTAIRKILGFSVPEEGPLAAYESWMPDFMSGLAKGIEANKFKVAQAIQGLSTDMTMGVKYNVLPNATGISQDMVLKTAQEVARGVLASSGSGGQNINITMPGMVIREEADIDKISEALAFKVRQTGMATGRVAW